MATTKQSKQSTSKQSTARRPAAIPQGWTDETSAAVGGKGEFFRFEPGATLTGVIVGPKRKVKSKYGERDVRDVEAADGVVFTVEPKAFAKRILELPAGTDVMLSVTDAPADGVEGSAWSGRLLTKADDVPF